MKTPRRTKQLALTSEAKDEERFEKALHLFKNARGQCDPKKKGLKIMFRIVSHALIH